MFAKPITFHLRGNATTREVWLDGERLDPAYSQAIRNHSPDGFNWGYGGSGPAQLALAICLQLMSKDDAQSFYQHLKYHVIAELPKGKDFEDDFTIEPAQP